jgi:uncharacterized protein (UPF0335 family)
MMSDQLDNVVHLKKVIDCLEAEKVKPQILEKYIMRLQRLEDEKQKENRVNSIIV